MVSELIKVRSLGKSYSASLVLVLCYLKMFISFATVVRVFVANFPQYSLSSLKSTK